MIGKKCYIFVLKQKSTETFSMLLFLTFGVLVAHLKKLLYKYTVANPARGLLNRGGGKKKNKSNSPPPRCSFEENKIKFTRRNFIPRRYAGLGPSRVRTKIPSTGRLDQ